MRCPIRSSVGFIVPCPYGQESCSYNFLEDVTYIYEFCPFDMRENGECLTSRLNKLTGEIEILVIQFDLGKGDD